MGVSASIPILQDRRLSVAWKPFLGEKGDKNPIVFSGRCFWLTGQWQAMYADGSYKEAKGLMGDWPFLNTPPFISLEPGAGAKGYEIPKELLLKYFFTVANTLEQYLVSIWRLGYPVTDEGLSLGQGNILFWGLDLSMIKDQVEQKEKFDLFLKWSADELPNSIIFEIIQPMDNDSPVSESFLVGKTDVKGEVKKEVGSILEHTGALKLTGKPREWHMKKIPGWPFALQEGMPAISARVKSNEDWRILFLLHKLYGRRFKNTVFVFRDPATKEFWLPFLHTLIKPTEELSKSAKKFISSDIKEKMFLAPGVPKNIFLVRDMLWRNDERAIFKEDVSGNNGQALFGWQFCFHILYHCKLKDKLWKKLFQDFGILGKLPIRFPVKNLIDEKKWIKFWQKKVGDLQLEELGYNIWTFSPPCDHWKTHGALAELLAYHSLLPLSNNITDLEKTLQIYPAFWQIKGQLKTMEIPMKLQKWPLWSNTISRYMAIQLDGMVSFG